MAKGFRAQALVRAYLATLFIALATVGPGAVHGTAAQAQPTIATAEDAKPFLGRWTTTFDSPQGAVTFDIDIHLDTGDPGASVSNSIIGDAEVSDVTKAGDALVLRYVAEVQGTQVPVSISLLAQGHTLKADFSFLGGEYAASSVATRKK
jgi:hypothetical protein